MWTRGGPWGLHEEVEVCFEVFQKKYCDLNEVSVYKEKQLLRFERGKIMEKEREAKMRSGCKELKKKEDGSKGGLQDPKA